MKPHHGGLAIAAACLLVWIFFASSGNNPPLPAAVCPLASGDAPGRVIANYDDRPLLLLGALGATSVALVQRICSGRQTCSVVLVSDFGDWMGDHQAAYWRNHDYLVHTLAKSYPGFRLRIENVPLCAIRSAADTLARLLDEIQFARIVVVDEWETHEDDWKRDHVRFRPERPTRVECVDSVLSALEAHRDGFVYVRSSPGVSVLEDPWESHVVVDAVNDWHTRRALDARVVTASAPVWGLWTAVADPVGTVVSADDVAAAAHRLTLVDTLLEEGCLHVRVSAVGNYAELSSQVAAWRALVDERERARRQSTDPWRQVVFTSYFTTKEDPQRAVRGRQQANRYEYMAAWYESLVALDMRGVIFHDGLRSGFIESVSRVGGDKVRFHRVGSLAHGRMANFSLNDVRFFHYLDYLVDHPEIERAFLTDISDVRFQRSPFELMDILQHTDDTAESDALHSQQRLYVGRDIAFFDSIHAIGWLQPRLALCFPPHTLPPGTLPAVIHLQHVYNAGILGAPRLPLIRLLTALTALLQLTPRHANCNMAVVNVVLHRYFDDAIFTGFPLSSLFMHYQVDPRGVYLVHK